MKRIEPHNPINMQDTGPGKDTETMVLQLQVVNQFVEIDRVNEEFNAFAAQCGLDDSVRRTVNLVFDELLNNIISYAFKEGANHQIDIRVHYDPNVLKITVADDGIPYDFLQTPTPPLDLSVEDRPLGGLGVYLVRQVMDEYEYERKNGENISTLIKHLA